MTHPYQPLFNLVRGIDMPWALLTPTLVLTLMETAAGLGVPLLTRGLIDGAATGPLPTRLILILAVVLLAQAAMSGVSLYLMRKAGENITAMLRAGLLRRLVNLPLKVHDHSESGELVSRTLSDTATVESLLTDQLVSLASGLLAMLGAICILWWLDWRMTLLLSASVLLGIVGILPVTLKLRVIGREVQETQGGFSARLTNLFGEMRLVKASCAEDWELERADRAIGRLRNLGLREARVLALLGPIMTMTITGAMVVILAYGGARVGSGAMAVGTLVAFILYLFQIVMPVVQLSGFFAALSKASGSAERIAKLMEEPEEDRNPNGERARAGEGLILRDVHFAYEPGKPVLNNFNLAIPAGEVTALVGPSGSGKTTLFALLQRFYQPGFGSILYGETPLEQMALEAWRRRIGYVSQEVPIISGTVRENLCYGLRVKPEKKRLDEALRAALADGFVADLARGLDTEVGERGLKLSGGQRQRLAIARAFLADPEILMLDEATANLDAASEEAVRTALDGLMAGRTTLIIAHRLATVRHAHRIAFIEEGRVTGLGNHDKLMDTHPLYQKYVARQMGGFSDPRRKERVESAD